MKTLILLILMSFSHLLAAEVIYLSDRLNFTNPDEISPKTEIKKRLPNGTYYSITENEWAKAIDGKKIAILIHGYNNELWSAESFCEKIIQRSENLYDTFICYLWPGGNETLEYLDARSRSIDFLPNRLFAIVQDLTLGNSVVDIIAHSMGCRLVLEMMQLDSRKSLRNVFLLAAAVDHDVLEQGERYHEGINNCNFMFIFHSYKDGVLRWSYPLVDFDEALGVGGSEDPEELPKHIFQIDSSDYVDSHGGYTESPFVFNIIRRVSTMWDAWYFNSYHRIAVRD